MNGDDKDTREAIAIIGLSFKFPQEATSAQYFWEMLMQGRTASTETPKSRMHTDAFRLSGGRQFDKVNTSSFIITFRYVYTNTLLSSQLARHVLLKMISQHLTRLSSPFLAKKRKLWIRSSACFWRQHTVLSKTVRLFRPPSRLH